LKGDFARGGCPTQSFFKLILLNRFCENSGVDSLICSEQQFVAGSKFVKMPVSIFNLIKDKAVKMPSLLGYNAATGAMTSMIESGILDPAKVTKSALTNAVSVGQMILTTDVLITDAPDKNPAPTAPSGMGGMGGMM
jgi:chaperonin GroEL (HSP60 family)